MITVVNVKFDKEESMTEQIGVMVAHEPTSEPLQTLQSAINEIKRRMAEDHYWRTYRRDAADMVREVLEDELQPLVDAVATEINRLTNAGLECAYGETMATAEAAEWVDLADAQSQEIKRLRAQNTELRAKLEDLHDKNVELERKLYQLRPQPDRRHPCATTSA